MGLPLRDTQRHNYGEYLGWPEDQRYELIGGEAYAMSPAPARDHQRISMELGRQIANALEDSPCEVYAAPFDVRLPRADEADNLVETVVQPDLSVICDPGKLDESGCRGAPDWVVEILSPSTAGHDQILKRDVYERAGVREYWIVHPTDRVVTVYLLEQGAYGKPDIFEMEGERSSSMLPEVVIDWSRFRADA